MTKSRILQAVVFLPVFFLPFQSVPTHSHESPEAVPVLSEQLRNAMRNGDTEIAAEFLNASPDQVNARDEKGSTPLILAALYAEADCVRLLLERGADANAKNNTGVTALMEVSGSVEKARMLLDAGAEVNASSEIGNTPLIRAAVFSNSTSLVDLLLERGADVNLCNRYGMSPLIAAAMSGNTETIQRLLERGADVNAKPILNATDKKGKPLEPLFGGGQNALMWSSLIGNKEAVKRLLDRGANANDESLFGTPLIMSAWRGNTDVARLLLDRGARVDQPDSMMAHFTPLLWAVASDNADPAFVELLIERGADPNAVGGDVKGSFMENPQTPLLWALRQGRQEIADVLRKHGAEKQEDPWLRKNPVPPVRNLPEGEIPSETITKAVRAAIPPLEKTAMESRRDFVVKGQNCATCHNQYLPLLALTAAKKKGIARDESVAKELREIYKKPFIQLGREIEEPTFHPAPAIEFGYALMSIAGEGVPADSYTDACVNNVAANQTEEGSWYNNVPRPPLMSTDIGATAWGVRALTLYPLPGRSEEMKERVERAARWMRNFQPRSTDDLVMQLLGLSWAGESRETLQPLVSDLIAQQREDGGWAQTLGLQSDAYATGMALFAMNDAAGIPAGHPAYQRGIRYLLTRQLEDGTWFVRRRTFPFQPTMKAGFPYGHDGWISAAATSWAVLALAPAIDPERPEQPDQAIVVLSTDPPGDRSNPLVVRPVDYSADIEPILSISCFGCHSSDHPRSRFRVDTYEHLFLKGEQGYVNVIPGDSENSPLVQYVSGRVEDMEMPPASVRAGIPALTDEQVALLRAWIDQGAKGPAEAIADVR